MVEIVLPNIQQVSPIWETGKVEHGFSGPMMTRWIVPVDNTNAMFLEFPRLPDDRSGVPGWWIDREQMLPAQLPTTDVYEDRQRNPGDYDSQVGQRPIAIHDLEHLATSDRASPAEDRALLHRTGIEIGEGYLALSPGRER